MLLKDKLFSLFFSIYIFWYPLACIFLGEQGAAVDGSAMRLILVSVFLLSNMFYFSYTRRVEEFRVWLILIIFGLTFYSTQFFYSFQSPGYQGQFLRWGADSVSACLMGMTLMKLKDYSFIHKLLPFVVITVTVFLAPPTFKLASIQGSMSLDSGMNYQVMAYTMALLFCLDFYYTLVYPLNTIRITKILMLAMLPVQAVACCMAGGRGGLVLLVVYLIAICFLMFRSKRISKTQIILYMLLGFSIFLVVANYFHLWESAGFSRSSGLVDDDDRFELWRYIWHYVEENNYMGYGIGGAYFSFGFYTHNIILDFIIETGIGGTIIFVGIFYSLYKRLYKCIALDNIFVVVSIICIYGLVMNLFSGYWITTYTHWLALGVVLTYSGHFKTYRKYLHRIR